MKLYCWWWELELELLGKNGFHLQWHALSKGEQAKYYEMARKERQVHMQLYPGWSARDNYAQSGKRKSKKRRRVGGGGSSISGGLPSSVPSAKSEASSDSSSVSCCVPSGPRLSAPPPLSSLIHQQPFSPPSELTCLPDYGSEVNGGTSAFFDVDDFSFA
jgi:hypothetical protein